MIKKYSLKTLEKAIQYALSMDQNSPNQLQALEGKVIEIIIEPLEIHFFIAIHDQQLKLLDRHLDKPDTIIRSSPLGLIRLSFLPASKARSLFNDKIKLLGDVETGQRLKKLIDELDIDWETHMAYFTGDVVAHQLGSLVRKGLAFKDKLTSSFKSNTRDYIQEELRLLPSKEETDDLFNDIDALVMQVERLQAKMNLMMNPYDDD